MTKHWGDRAVRRLGAACAAGCLLLGANTHAAAVAGGDAARTPVLVELFTSEGCSSCPPADAFLERLDKLQPVAGVRIIVMSEHVDYWNHDGWNDPFSSPEFTLRQQAYSKTLKLTGPYTPQMVVDGARECIGNDVAAAQAAISEAAQQPAIEVRIGAGARPQSVTVSVEGPAIARAGDIYLAVADDEGSTEVKAGENSGHTLHYVAIVTKLERIGKLGRGAKFHIEIPIGTFNGKRLIAFVQEPDMGRVLGAAEYNVPK